MRSKHLQTLTRVVGVLSALGAIAAFIYGASFLRPTKAPIVAAFWFVLGCTLLRGAYLEWLHWSPLAVRHALGTLFFVPSVALTLLSYRLLLDYSHSVRLPWALAVPCVVILICYFLFRITAARLSKVASELEPNL